MSRKENVNGNRAAAKTAGRQITRDPPLRLTALLAVVFGSLTFRTPKCFQFADRPSAGCCLICFRLGRQATFAERTDVRGAGDVDCYLLFRDRSPDKPRKHGLQSPSSKPVPMISKGIKERFAPNVAANRADYGSNENRVAGKPKGSFNDPHANAESAQATDEDAPKCPFHCIGPHRNCPIACGKKLFRLRSWAERRSIRRTTINGKCVLFRTLQEPIVCKRALHEPIELKQSRDTASNVDNGWSTQFACGSMRAGVETANVQAQRHLGAGGAPPKPSHLRIR